MTFYSALVSSLIAEVHRLDALFAEQAKSDLLAGLSHELRSPLHGLFGTAELLSDTVMDALQRGFVHTIASCANTLLGSINQLLEFSGINDLNQNRGMESLPSLGRQSSAASQSDPTSSVQVDITVEDTVEAIFAGFCFFHSSRLPLRAGSGANVTLPGRSIITISVQDTGCGMDPEYVRNGYFTPFSQENDMLPGNGLGASITQKTVQSIHGDIEVRSQRGIGTHVQISLTLDHAPERTPSEESLNDNTHAGDLAPTRELVRRKSIGILGFGTSDLHTSTSSSLENVCREWLQMNVVFVSPSDSNFPHCDFYIALHDYLDIGNLEIKAIAPGPEARFSSPIIVICSSPRSAHSLLLAAQQRGDAEVLEFISQPCGPRKLANSLEVCIKRQNRRISGLKASQSTVASYLDKPERQITPIFNTEPSSCSGLWTTSASKSSMSLSQGQDHMEPPRQYIPPLADKDYSSLVAPAVLPSPEAGASPIYESNAQVTPLTQLQAPFTVLLVDDNHINISLLVAYMKKLGFEYIIAQNGQEALDRFKESFSNIRIILMDINMSIMDGLESSRQIRAFENTLNSPAYVPIIALTGVAQAELQRDAIGSGMNLFLTKPVRLDEIAVVIEDHTGINIAYLKAGRK
ncbi:hypothetical protein N7451_012876 [Penicillium sp. IBT 35674x]|nr:hypothetical protein N7451_012876 [Penicillium sp. IBT 35674x]